MVLSELFAQQLNAGVSEPYVTPNLWNIPVCQVCAEEPAVPDAV